MIFISFIVLLPVAWLQDPNEPCPGGSCNPQLGDLMVGRAAQLSASSTCGLHGPQNYCIIGYLEEEQKCFSCDSQLPYNRYSNPNSHRIENIITTFDPERKMKWWQSENGVHEVSIRLDLETVFQFSHLVLTFKSFRPQAMLVERSKDFGRTWKVFRYFAEDCSLHFPSVPEQPADSIDDVVCDSRYSGSDPSTDGEVVLKALDPIFEIEDPYAPNIQDLITLTNIRLNFTRLFTLGDTLLGRRRRNPQEKYYYALYNMVMRGSCFCNGHASQCVPVDPGRGDAFSQPGMVHGRCVCQHNTAGENCERCQDLHSDSPWRPGGESATDVCRRCNCHGHSDSCHFDGARFDATGGVSGGVCDNCRNDRTGPQCESCRPFMYQDPSRPVEDPQGCIPCDCDPTGSEGGGLCDAVSGQCVCKANVDGQRCDRCKHGFFGLRPDDPAGCQECRCHAVGSLGSCDQETGSCQCDRLASGPLCDQCPDGFWGLGSTQTTCTPCDCDVGGAHSSSCSQDGQCQCLPNMSGLRCADPAPGHFLPALDYFLYEAERAAPLPEYSSPPTPPPPPPPPPSQPSPLVNPDPVHPYPEHPYPEHPDPVYPPPVHPDPVHPDPVYPDPAHPYPEQPYPEQPYPEQPHPEQPYPEQPHPEQPYPEQPYPEHPDPEQPYPEQPYPEQPHPEQPHPEQPYPEQPYPEQPYPEQPHPEQPYPEQPYPEQPYPEQPYPEQPYPEQPYPEQPHPEHPYPEHPDPVYPHPEHPDPVHPDPGYPDPGHPDQWDPNQIHHWHPNNVHPDHWHPDSSSPHQIHPDQSRPVLLPDCEKYLVERGYDFKFSNGQIVLVRRSRRLARRKKRQQSNIPLYPGRALQVIPRQRTPGQRVTWTGPGFVRVLEGAGLRFTVDNIPSSMNYHLMIRYEPEGPSDWLASISITPVSLGDGGCTSDPTGSHTLALPGNARGAVIDSPVCLNAQGRYFVDVVFNKQPGVTPSTHILIDSMGLIPAIDSVQNLCSQTDIESFRRFQCVGLAAEADPNESLPDVCESLIKSMSARINKGAVPCGCNVDGSLGPYCSKLGGICECKPNVIGRCCDTCAPLAFGFGPDGCTPCECDPRGSVSELCDQVRGQCACRTETAGRRCEHCQTGYWDFPSCRPCECNELSEECNQETGECLNCREHATGPRCDRCEEGYYGNPASRQPCQPCLCPDVMGSGQFYATSCNYDPQSLSLTCNCQEGHTGPSCNRCGPGFYGNPSFPGGACERCPCNDNIDPGDRDACDSLTGECLHCLHNTVGPQCQDCKPGYYGNALVQDCKECSCDRRGTEVTLCPLESPCFCDTSTGQCPCRMGVEGVLCDECADGYWNLDSGLGCQPCSCDSANSFSNTCDKVTGQCPCRPEYGGRQCDECGENHFGNPDLQCVSCDCNLDGTERPACDPETGECNCRVGVTGIFCDECAPGYDSAFPACKECHPCRALWDKDVTDVKRAAQKMRTFIPQDKDDRWLENNRNQQRMLDLHSKLDGLSNLTSLSLPKLKRAEKLAEMIKKLRDATDPHVILIDPSVLLNNEIDNIRMELKKLLTNLQDKLDKDPDSEDEPPEELLDEIQKLFKAFMEDEKRVKDATKAVEDSMDTRQQAKQKLGQCVKGDLEPLEKEIQELSVESLNRQICGAPGLLQFWDCSGCGGALCVLESGKRKCGGTNCDGGLPLAEKAVEDAEKAKEQLAKLPSRLQESMNKIKDANKAANDTKDLAKVLQDRIAENLDSFEREKNKTKELIQKVKNYLMDEMIPPEDIEKMARAVLAIQLPKSPDQIRSMIDEINDLLANATKSQENLEDLKEQAEVAKDLLQKAQDVKKRAEAVDPTQILRDIYDAHKAQDNANNDLEAASDDMGMAKRNVQETHRQLDDIEAKLMNRRPQDLKDEIEALKRKIEQNRQAAADALQAADAALNSTVTETELENVTKLFELLKQKKANQTSQSEAEKQLKDIVAEVEKLKKQMQDKLREIQELEDKITQLMKSKEDKAAEVSTLLETVDSLRKEISKRAEGYAICIT